jgi:hypothetical protein
MALQEASAATAVVSTVVEVISFMIDSFRKERLNINTIVYIHSIYI